MLNAAAQLHLSMVTYGKTRVYAPTVEAENNDRLKAASFDELHNLVDIIRGGGAPLAPATTSTPAPSATPATPSATTVMPIPVSKNIIFTSIAEVKSLH